MTDRTEDSSGSTASDSRDEKTPEIDGFDSSPRSARSSGFDAGDGIRRQERDGLEAGRDDATLDPGNDDLARPGRDSHADADADDRDDAHRDGAHRGDVGRADTVDHDDTVDHHDAREQVTARNHVNGRTTGLTPTGSHPTSSPRAHDVSYAVGPFSVREVALVGLWAVAFLVSFFPDNNVAGGARLLLGGTNVWLSGLWWIPAIALPTVAVGLLVLRRLSPQGIRRVGSLGIDQFASVSFSVAAFVWVAWVWQTVAIAAETGGWVRGWVVWVEAVLMLAGVVLTVAAPFIRPFSSDFVGREEVAAHRLARPIRPVVPRPRAPRPVRRSAAPSDAATPGSATPDTALPGSYTGSTEVPAFADTAPPTSVLPTHDDGTGPVRVGRSSLTEHEVPGDDHPTDVIASTHEVERDTAHGSNAHPAAQAFWALAPVERDVVDDYGTPIFRIGPTAWALVIEDRGETFVVRHDDGRIGYLHDVSGVTRG
ncbi:MAG: hypothetical protein PIR02_18680 [Microbacterium enclense]